VTTTINTTLTIAAGIACGLLFGCSANPGTVPEAPATPLAARVTPLTIPATNPPTSTPAPGFTPEVTQRNAAGVPLPDAPGARNVVVTYTPVAPGASQLKSGFQSVSVGDNYFYPEELRITVGSTIEWDYNGGGGETESIHNVIASDNAFSSGDLNPGSRFAFVFERPGEFDYVCSYHVKQMTGKVFVQ
jgi:plastocyanin